MLPFGCIIIAATTGAAVGDGGGDYESWSAPLEPTSSATQATTASPYGAVPRLMNVSALFTVFFVFVVVD